MAAELTVDELIDRWSCGCCLACRAETQSAVLCAGCRPSAPPGAFAAQIRSVHPRLEDRLAHACLFDGFGQTHHVCVVAADDALISIGRDMQCPVSIVDRSVSREHAALIYRAEDSGWYLQDLGSRNGTTVDAVSIGATPHRLSAGARVGVANFEFLFLASSGGDAERLTELVDACRPREFSTVSQFQVRRITFAPTDGAGGFVIVEHSLPSGQQRIPISLSDLDFALLHLLADRYLEMSNFEDQARGWVSSSELLDERLPFGTETPTSNNLRGAIKRIRDKFRKHGIERVIESRQNMGYRLTPGFEEVLL